jgi:hypothetical protein
MTRVDRDEFGDERAVRVAVGDDEEWNEGSDAGEPKQRQQQ